MAYLYTLKELFFCTICSRILYPDPRTCSFGHIICGACFIAQDSYDCPVCRDTWGLAPCPLLNRLTASLPFPCQFFELGCREYYSIDDWHRHNGACPVNMAINLAALTVEDNRAPGDDLPVTDM